MMLVLVLMEVVFMVVILLTLPRMVNHAYTRGYAEGERWRKENFSKDPESSL